MRNNSGIFIYSIEDFIILEVLVLIFFLNAYFMDVLIRGLLILILTIVNIRFFTKIALLRNEHIEYNNAISFFILKSTKVIFWDSITSIELFYGQAAYTSPVLSIYAKKIILLKIRIQSFRKINEIRKLTEQKGIDFKFKAPTSIVKKIISK